MFGEAGPPLIFDGVPTDDNVYIRRIVLKPSDDLHLRTKLGLRQVTEVKMAVALRWKHEQVLLRDARVVTYRPADSNETLPNQVRAEFESKDATHSNLRFGMQFVPGSTEAAFTIELLPAKTSDG